MFHILRAVTLPVSAALLIAHSSWTPVSAASDGSDLSDIAGPSSAAPVVPLPGSEVLALQIGKSLKPTREQLAAYLGIPKWWKQYRNWQIEAVDSSSLFIEKVGSDRVSIMPLAEGVHEGMFFFSPEHSPLPFRVVGYRLDRSGIVFPDIIDEDGDEYHRDTPVRLRCSIVIRPYVENIRFDFDLFAHDSTFFDGSRSFSVTTGIGETTNGFPGFKTSVSENGVVEGVFTFDMLKPAGEGSWCVKTKQTQIWESLPAFIETGDS